MARRFEYDQVLHELPEKGGAYVVFPWNIREVFGKEMPAVLEGPSGIQLFFYDSGHIIVRSDLPYMEDVTLKVADGVHMAKDIVRNVELSVTGGRLLLHTVPGVNCVLELIK